LTGRDFHTDRPGTKLVGDITFLPTDEGRLQLACWPALATREVVGYAPATTTAPSSSIETFYDRRRLRKHKVCGYLTPAETRQRHQHAPATWRSNGQNHGETSRERQAQR
jgi:hypothetical protein